MKLNQLIKTFSNPLAIFFIGFLFLISTAFHANAQNQITFGRNIEFGNFSNWGAGNLYLSADNNSNVTHDGNVMDMPNVVPKITPQSGLIYAPFFKNDPYTSFTVSYSLNNVLKSGSNTISFIPSPASGTVFQDTNWKANTINVYIGGKLAFTQQMPVGRYTGTLIVYCTYHGN